MISKSDNNKQIIASNDYNKQHFQCSNSMSWPGLCESENIKQMITLTVITLGGAYCICYKPTTVSMFVCNTDLYFTNFLF